MMTDVRNGSSENDNNSCDSDDQQELESYLYSLIHHDTSVGNEISQGDVEEIPPPAQEHPTGPQKGWRYFNLGCTVRPYQTRNERFSERLKELSERFNCNTVRSRGPSLPKIPFWRRSQPAVSYKVMDHSRNKASQNSPNLPSARSSPSIASFTGLEVKETPSHNNDTESRSTSLSLQCVSTETPSCPPVNDDTDKEGNTRNLSKENSANTNVLQPVEQNDDLNNTNPSLSSFDDCFELPQTSFSKPKSKSAQNLNECMTQVLGSMLDEDASRSSIESDKRPLSKPSKNGSSSGWTVGMSWEDMSSKFRFNFEVDSVCGDSVREGSISSSRANTPDPTVETLQEPDSPEEESKYNVSLKKKESASDSMAVNGESDSEVESIVEVFQPDKEPPPVVEILSDSEDVAPPKIIKLDDEDPIEEDIVVLYEAGKSSSNKEARNVNLITSTTSEANVGSPARRKERQRKRAKRQSEATPIDDISSILAGMSNDPSLWRLCRDDVYPKPSSRKWRACDNCKQRDHITRHCPEPIKIKVCSLCAQPGHNHYSCPNRMCLSCGAKAPSFVRRCHQCIRNKQICSICKWTGHNTKQCPDLWRRYHSTTSVGPPVAPADSEVEPAAEMWCCNCASKGHYSHDCTITCSPINEKIYSHVVSYADPWNGERSQPVEAPGQSGAQIQGTAKTSLQESGSTSPSLTFPRTKKGRAASRALSVNYFKKPIFQVNYPTLMSHVTGVNHLPSQAHSLAALLEGQLQLIEKPVLQDSEVTTIFVQLMKHMQRPKFRKNTIRKASQCAAQLNMTLIGYGGLAQGEVHVRELRKHLAALRMRTGKVPLNIKSAINSHYQVIFKGYLRNDLNLLIKEYLKRENRVST